MSNDNSTDDRGLEDDARPEVSALASAVISVLSDKSDEAAMTIRASVVRKLVRATLEGGTFDAEALLAELRDNRVVPEQIVDIYIPEASRQLGTMWVDDTIGFANVSIATARLQGLLTMLAAPWSSVPTDRNDELNVLLILQNGDTHTLGPHVATAQLRRMGASVRLLFGPSTENIIRILSEEHYDLMMFSCSHTESLSRIAKTIKRIKSQVNLAPPIALGGLVLELTDRVKEKTGVDLVTGDVKVACKLCDKKRQRHRSVAR